MRLSDMAEIRRAPPAASFRSTRSNLPVSAFPRAVLALLLDIFGKGLGVFKLIGSAAIVDAMRGLATNYAENWNCKVVQPSKGIWVHLAGRRRSRCLCPCIGADEGGGPDARRRPALYFRSGAGSRENHGGRASARWACPPRHNHAAVAAAGFAIATMTAAAFGRAVSMAADATVVATAAGAKAVGAADSADASAVPAGRAQDPARMPEYSMR